MTVSTADRRAFWVLLSMVAGIGPVRLARLLEVCGGDAEAAWHATDVQLQSAGFERRTAESMRRLRATTTPKMAMERLARLEVRPITLEDDDYPGSLRQIADPPPVLFVRGRLDSRDTLAVAVVGTRRATAYGRAVAERFARDLAVAGVTVVSGLAKGIDTVAHRAAVEAGGRTLAVLGHGLHEIYPPENLRLARQIVEEDAGAVVTEFPPGVPPDAANFPRRNRIIAGLCSATVIVEAGVRSGALITADFALEQGRDVLAVPGSILSPTSAGTNNLLRQGAAPATSALDILEVLGLDAVVGSSAQRVQALPPDEAAVLAALGAEPVGADEVARSVATGAGDVAAALTLLELKGLVRNVGGGAYVRA